MPHQRQELYFIHYTREFIGMDGESVKKIVQPMTMCQCLTRGIFKREKVDFLWIDMNISRASPEWLPLKVGVLCEKEKRNEIAPRYWFNL